LADATLAAAAAEKELEKTKEVKESSGGNSGGSSSGSTGNAFAPPSKTSEENSDTQTYKGYSAYKALSSSEKTLINTIANQIAKNGNADVGGSAIIHKDEVLSMIYEILKDKHSMTGYWRTYDNGTYYFG
jgi:hypothetical protein